MIPQHTLLAPFFHLLYHSHCCRSLQESSEAVQRLVPLVVIQSRNVADNPQDLSHLDDFKASGKELVQRVHLFVEEMDKSALPWSQCAQRVIGSAATPRQMEAEVGP